mmetsp:Transcript_901/g.1856  ORF Transcript_901/g.1856 Transcript_901/m.1856 type:complete len:205 (+) Transcript_901:788-1402(+)
MSVRGTTNGRLATSEMSRGEAPLHEGATRRAGMPTTSGATCGVMIFGRPPATAANARIGQGTTTVAATQETIGERRGASTRRGKTTATSGHATTARLSAGRTTSLGVMAAAAATMATGIWEPEEAMAAAMTNGATSGVSMRPPRTVARATSRRRSVCAPTPSPSRRLPRRRARRRSWQGCVRSRPRRTEASDSWRALVATTRGL